MGEIVIVCGGREFGVERPGAAAQIERSMFYAAMDAWHARMEISAVIEGGQKGADDLARDWSGDRRRGHLRVEAEWKRLGRDAGPARNARMLREHPIDRVLCFPGGDGTDNMRRQALAQHLPVVNFILAGDRLEPRIVEQPALI